MLLNGLAMLVRTYTVAQAVTLLLRAQTSTDEYRKGLSALERYSPEPNPKPNPNPNPDPDPH